MTTIELLERTKAAWGSIRSASAEEKDRLLLAMAESLEANSEDILRENAKDMEAAKGTISDVMLDRLALTESRHPTRWPRASARLRRCPTTWAARSRSSSAPMV